MYNFLQHLFGGPVSKCDPCSLTEVVLSTGQHCAAWLDIMISVLALHHSQARPSGLHWPQWTTLAGLEQQYTTAFYNRATLSLSPSLLANKGLTPPPRDKEMTTRWHSQLTLTHWSCLAGSQLWARSPQVVISLLSGPFLFSQWPNDVCIGAGAERRHCVVYRVHWDWLEACRGRLRMCGWYQDGWLFWTEPVRGKVTCTTVILSSHQPIRGRHNRRGTNQRPS